MDAAPRMHKGNLQTLTARKSDSYTGWLSGIHRKRKGAASGGRRTRRNSGQDSSPSPRKRQPRKPIRQPIRQWRHCCITQHHAQPCRCTRHASINYGMDTSTEGRMVMKNMLLVTEAGAEQRQNCYLPHPDFPCEGWRKLQPRRTQL